MEQKNNEDKDISGVSSSTSLSSSISSTIIQDITKNKNIFLISKGFESKIIDILSYLQNDSNLATNKIIILRYMKSLFINVEFNSEIFIRKFSNEKKKLNLYQLIISQYILYTNPENSKVDEESYRSELQDLFILLLSQVTIEREIYHYILSFLFNYNKEKSFNKNSSINNAEYLSRILQLLQNFYKYIQSYNEPSNFFFFSGDSDSSITIPNIEHPKDPNKKLLNFDETLCIILFIKLIPSDLIKSVYPKASFKLLKMCFNDKNKKTNNNNNILLDIDIDNNLLTNFQNEPLVKLPDDQMNCILVKFKNKKKLSIEIFINNKKFIVESQNNYKDEEIKEIILFKNFIGYCSNIIIYKEKKMDGLPKFLLCSDEESKIRASLRSTTKDVKKKSTKSIKSLFYIKCIFPFGFYNEEEYSNLVKVELKNQMDENQYNEIYPPSNEKRNIINEKEVLEFLNNNLIAIYMPTRIDYHPKNDEKNILTAHQIILRDSINNLDAEFNIRTPSLNGVHIYSRITDDFKIIGGINNLLPIIDYMTNYNELLTNENLSKFFSLITYYVFSPQYEKALIKEKDSNFFLQLSYFLEKIPDEFFDRQLSGNLKSISSFLITNNENDFYELNQQFHNYIIMNEKILFKFKYSEQKELLEQITEIIKSTDSDRKILDISIINLVKILLYYDKKKYLHFCCKEHSKYFNGNYDIMEPVLNERIEPVINLLNNIIDKKTNEKKYIQLDQLYKLLTFDLSPCLQKSILCIFTKIMEKYSELKNNIILNLEQLLNVVLFIFKSSVFDVKINALNLILLISKNNLKLNLNDFDKTIFITNNILPYHLFNENVDVLKELNKNDEKEDNDKENEVNEKNISTQNNCSLNKNEEEEKKSGKILKGSEDKSKESENKNKEKNKTEKEEKIEEKNNKKEIVVEAENIEKKVESKEIVEKKENAEKKAELNEADENKEKGEKEDKKENKELEDNKESKENEKKEDKKENKENKEIEDNKENKEIEDNKESKEIEDNKESKENKELEDNKELEGNKEIEDKKENKELEDNKETEKKEDKKINEDNKENTKKVDNIGNNENEKKVDNIENKENEKKEDNLENNENEKKVDNIENKENKKKEDNKENKDSKEDESNKENKDIIENVKKEDNNENQVNKESQDNKENESKKETKEITKMENTNKEDNLEIKEKEKKEDINEFKEKEKVEKIENQENTKNEDKKENLENKDDNQNKTQKLNESEEKEINKEKQEITNNEIKDKKENEKSENQINEEKKINNIQEITTKKEKEINNSNTEVKNEINVIYENIEEENNKNTLITNNTLKNKSKSSIGLKILPSITETNKDEFLSSDIQTLNINNENITKHKSENDIRISNFDEDELFNTNEENQKNFLKKSLTINNSRFKIISLTENQKKINNLYNKNKLKDLASGLYSQSFKYFEEDICPDITFTYLIKLVSRSDLSFIDSFLTRIYDLNKNNEKKFLQIITNDDFLQFLIETFFQAYMIQNNYSDFVSGFSVEFNKNDLNNTENSEILKEIFENCKKLLKMVFKNNIYKIDYLLTWCRYFLELNNEKNKFELAKNFFDGFINDFATDEIKVIVNADIENNPILKNTLYFFNIYFEFCTFHKMKYFDSFYDFNDKEKIYQKISKDFKYILLSKIILKNFSISKKNDIDLTPEEKMQKIDTKFVFYPLFNLLYSSFTPLWKDESQRNRKVNDIFTYITKEKDIYLKELELLFYSFEDINKNLFCNKGTPLIILLYHSFCLILNIGGEIIEIKEYFENFKSFIMLIVISSATVTSTVTSKKKKWPNEEQYKKIQNIVEAGIFNFIFFLIDKVKNIQNELKNLSENIQENNSENKKNLDYLKNINSIYIENLAFLLKILNKIYREIKKDEYEKNKNKKFYNSFLKSFKKESENFRKFGGYIFIEKLYRECSSLNINEKSNSIDPGNDNISNINDDISTNSNIINNSIRVSFHISNMPNISNEEDFPDVNATLNTDCPKLNSARETDINKIKNKGKKSLLKYKTEKVPFKPKNLQYTFTPNYLDELYCDFNEENYPKIEKNINNFINDFQIEQFYDVHKDEYLKFLFPFLEYMKNRQNMIKTLIPIYNYRQNISEYPRDLCVLPSYFQESSYDLKLKKIIENKNVELKDELESNQKEKQMLEYYKYQLYKKTKKKLFSFTGIWSNEEYFYDNDKYKLKYKLYNHMTEDYTRIFLTPILDIDYYLPTFTKYKGNIFRNLETSIPICKIVNIHFYKNSNIVNEKNDNNNNNNNINIINDINISNKSFDSLNNSQNSKNNEEIINPLYDLFKENYSFIINSNSVHKTDLELFNNYIKKKHFTNFKDSFYLIINDCCFIKAQYHIGGTIYINEKELGFYSYETIRNGDEEDYDSSRKTCFGSTFKQQTEKYIGYYLCIPWNEVNFILKRRYYFKKTALEIYSINKKSYLFRIPENKFTKLYENIRHYLKTDIEDILIEYDKTDEKIGFYSKKNIIIDSLYFGKKGMNLKTLYEKWTKWEISTLKILMLLNIYSNRSYNDINQYPVFPWIITDYISNKLPQIDTNNFIRPLNKPMGMLEISDESKERKEDYEEHWKNAESDPDKEENYDRYCTHYSTAFYLTYYLVRVFPFSFIRIELQGKNFDDPNRLFNSVPNSWLCATTQKADIRELIPEFFCFPEMFYNFNELNLGEVSKNNNKILVEDIEMPNWANDGYNFVMKHRELLESTEISEKINEWFNIIFGSKQKGKNAKKIGNLFLRQSYESFEGEYVKANKAEKNYYKHMLEFGVTPNRIFKNDTAKRKSCKEIQKKNCLLFNISTRVGKNDDISCCINNNNSLKIDEADFYVEGSPYRIFIFMHKKMYARNEKIYFLSKDKINIFSKTNEKKNLKEKIITEKEKTKIQTNIENDKENNVIKENENNDENKEENDNIKEIEDNNKEIISKNEKNLTSLKYRINHIEAPTIIYDKGNYIALGGFYNGQIIINKIEDIELTKKTKNKPFIKIYNTDQLYPINHMIMDTLESFIICTNTKGVIYIYEINQNNKSEWIIDKVLYDHENEITSIDINENLNIFITCHNDGYCMLYSLPNCKLFNSFKLHENVISNNNLSISNTSTGNNSSTNLYASNVIISHCPLPCIVFYIKSRKSLSVYSINLHFLKEIFLEYNIVTNGIKKYSDFMCRDYIFIYNCINQTIDVYDLADLNMVTRSLKINYFFIDFHFSKELDHALILVKNQEKTEDDKRQKIFKVLVLKAPGDNNKLF